VQPDASGISQYDGSDANELVADRRAGGIRQSGVFQYHAPDVIEEHIGR